MSTDGGGAARRRSALTDVSSSLGSFETTVSTQVSPPKGGSNSVEPHSHFFCYASKNERAS